MTITLAFDVYGTLIDTQGVLKELEKQVGDRAPEFSRTWREKQLEYSFRRGLMQRYEDFARCTKDALRYTSSLMKVPLGGGAEESILSAYKTLPAFPDVREGLIRLQSAGFRMFAFSNGLAGAVDQLLANAGIRGYFHDVVSVDEVGTFKPSPVVYGHFLNRAGTVAAQAWLISSNPFDVIGAVSSGMRAAWVQRSPEAVFDPWGIDPTITVSTVAELADKLPTESRRA